MRKEVIVLILATAVVMATPAFAAAQGAETAEETEIRIDHTAAQPSIPPPDGWRSCPRCQNSQDRLDGWEEHGVEGRDFDPHDLSGVWGFDGVGRAFRSSPPLTEWGQQWLDARDGVRPESRNTPELRTCDPLAYPRLFSYNYGFEFVMLPDRVLQFFEWGHTWRTIWTDGRELPDEPPILHFLGWNVGHWEGDTFVIESNGFDERAWASDEMRLEERYRRVDYGTLEAELTINDPKMYTEPFVTSGTIELVPSAELWEYFCVPSDEKLFDELIHIPVSAQE